MTVLGIPDHLHAALDMLGVRMPDKPKQPKRGLPETTANNTWFKESKECPF